MGTHITSRVFLAAMYAVFFFSSRRDGGELFWAPKGVSKKGVRRTGVLNYVSRGVCVVL